MSRSRLHTSRRCLLTGGAGLGTAKGTAVAALERIGGVMVYDVTDPAAPVFQEYRHTRAFVGATIGPDSGPEGLVFIPPAASPSCRAMLAAGNEVTGTVNLWGLSRRGHRRDTLHRPTHDRMEADPPRPGPATARSRWAFAPARRSTRSEGVRT